VGCSENISNEHYNSNDKSKLVREISSKVFVKLKNEKKLYPIECGGGGSDLIKLLHWGFFYYKDINIEEARELLMIASEQFLMAFNSDSRIHPHLDSCPFKPKNMQLEIFLKKPDGSELGPETLHVISMTKGILEYAIESSETGHLKTVFVETYEEAAAKLSETYKVHGEHQ
jgi:hypothetical protein